MDMFNNYNNIPENYTPNNFKKCLDVPDCNSKLIVIETSNPYAIVNINGDLLGYSWNYGDTLNLHFKLIGEFDVENSEPIYFISHNCKDVPDSPQVSQITAEEFVKDKTIEIEFLNFRQEVVYSKTLPGSVDIIIPIDDTIYNKLYKGVYTLNIYLKNDNSNIAIFNKEDCIILIK